MKRAYRVRPFLCLMAKQCSHLLVYASGVCILFCSFANSQTSGSPDSKRTARPLRAMAKDSALTQSPRFIPDGFRHRKSVRHRPASNTVSGDVSCTVLAEQPYSCMDVSAVDFDGGVCSLISQYGPFVIVKPDDTTVTASCSVRNNGTLEGFADVGTKSTNYVWGRTDVTATCVIATMECSATIDADFEGYSFVKNNGDFGPLLGYVSFSGMATTAGMTIGTDPQTERYGVVEIHANYSGPGNEWIAEPLAMVNAPLSPTAVLPGSPGFNLTVNGSGFFPDSSVQWNGSSLPTTFVSSTHLEAAVPAENVALAGTAALEPVA